IFYADLHGHLEVLPWHAAASTRRAARAARTESREQIREIQIVERELFGTVAAVLPRPVGRRAELLTLRPASQFVVCRALLGILERLVRLGDFLEFRFRARFLRNIGMIFLRETAIGLLDLVGGGAAL